MTDAGPSLGSILAADDGDRSFFKVLLLLVVVVVSVINAAVKRAKARAAERPIRPPAPIPEGERERTGDGESYGRLEEFEQEMPTPERTPPRTAPARSPRPSDVQARHKGMVADAHVEVGTRLPTADDMPGAHSTQDHVHLTEIGADRGTSAKHRGTHPTAAATVMRRRGISGHDLLRANNLVGRDRTRAGILWAEVFGPPRSRARARR